MPEKECLVCGMAVSAAMLQCPKCDNALDEQHDGSTVTVDIAHNHETVREANQKLDRALDSARQSFARNIRVILGNGRIREDVLGRLEYMKRTGDIVRYTVEKGNRGAVVIQLKK